MDVNDVAIIVLTVLSLLVLFVGLPVAILWLRDRVSNARRGRRTPAKLPADRHAYEERILQPDWKFYEHHLQRPVPAALRELYSDRALVTGQNLTYSKQESISTFGVLDEEDMLDTKPWLGFDAVAIATSDFGDPIYLRPGPSETDTVYITHHDGGDTEVFAESTAFMVAKLRQACRDPQG